MSKKGIYASAIARLGGINGAGAALHGPEDEAGKRMTSRRSKEGKRRLAIGERETARELTGLKSVVTIAAKLSAKLQAVLAAQIAEGILVNVTLGRVDVLAPNAEERSNLNMAAEFHGREAVVGNARNSQLRSEFGVIGDVVLVLKTVVAHREFIHAAAADRPCMGDAHLRTTHDLSLNGVDRLSGKGQECPAVVPVIPVSLIPSKGPPKLLPAREDVIDFAGIRIPREYWAAAVESEGVIDVSWQRRVRNHGEENRCSITELSGRDNV